MGNPYDSQARGALGAASGDPSLWDWAFYHGRYYCYFGPLPAIVLFAPFKALTGTDLSTAAACAILAIAACASLVFLMQTLWKRFWKGTPRWFAVLAYTAIVAASGLSYLVLVPWFYSIPILASLALAPVGIALWTRSADDIGSAPRIGMIAAGSLLVALTITCRPTFILLADRHDCSLPRAWTRTASAVSDDNRSARSLEPFESGALRVAAGIVHALSASAAAGFTAICSRPVPIRMVASEMRRPLTHPSGDIR